VRHAALGSIGRIPSLEAVEYLISTLGHAAGEERQKALELLVRNDAPEASGAWKAALSDAPPELSSLLDHILRARAR
jgi:hypothetical protein